MWVMPRTDDGDVVGGDNGVVPGEEKVRKRKKPIPAIFP